MAVHNHSYDTGKHSDTVIVGFADKGVYVSNFQKTDDSVQEMRSQAA